MRRSGDIRGALSTLCRVLSLCGCALDPETFRKAKFNRPEAASEFWKLLYCLLQQIYSNDLSSISRNEKGIKGNDIKYVKSILQLEGYGRPAFYELPDDGTEGSREALLAFSWLLYTGKILEKVLKTKRVKLGDHITFCMCSQNIDFKAVKDFMKSSKQDLDVRYLQWLNGRLRLCWRNLHTVHLEKCSMLYKILQCLKSENSCLETCLEWGHFEMVYWQWLETVFQSALEDECITSPQNEINLYTSFPSECKPPSNLIHIKALQKSFCDVHDQFHELLKHQKLASREQIKELDRCVKEKESSLSIGQIKQEVRWLKHQNEQVSNAHGLLRVDFKENKCNEAIHKYFNLKNIHATDLTTMLHAAATKLETELQNLQDESKKRLDEKITEKLEGIVCIPPAKC